MSRTGETPNRPTSPRWTDPPRACVGPGRLRTPPLQESAPSGGKLRPTSHRRNRQARRPGPPHQEGPRSPTPNSLSCVSAFLRAIFHLVAEEHTHATGKPAGIAGNLANGPKTPCRNPEPNLQFPRAIADTRVPTNRSTQAVGVLAHPDGRFLCRRSAPHARTAVEISARWRNHREYTVLVQSLQPHTVIIYTV